MFEQYVSQPLELSLTQFVLGDFIFSLPENTPIASMGRRFDGGWVVIDLLNDLPMQQQTGRRLDEITFRCEWFKDEGSAGIDKLVAMRAQGKPQSLVRGDGKILGQWVLVQFETDESWMYQEGKTMKQQVTISLREWANKPAEQKKAGEKSSSSGSPASSSSKGGGK